MRAKSAKRLNKVISDDQLPEHIEPDSTQAKKYRKRKWYTLNWKQRSKITNKDGIK